MSKIELNYLSKLVAYRTVSGDIQASKECAKYCEDFFKNHGLYTKIIEVNNFPSLFATTQNTLKPKILLQAHMDVVPAPDRLFDMKITEKKIYGRGVFDMKFACASFMKVADELADSLDQYDFGVMLTFDEEIGGHNGVEALLEKGYGCEVCILPDSGQNWNLECSAKGAWFICVSKTGKNAHASVAHEGLNAAELLIPVISDLLKIRNKYEFDDLSINLTKHQSGKAMNQIPNYAEATFDIRYKNKDILAETKSQIERVCKKHNASLSTKEFGHCMNVAKDNIHLKNFVPIAEKVLGKKIKHTSSAGSTDGRYFCAKDIPTIVIQPNGGCRHGDKEWIEAGGMEKLTQIILQYIVQYAKIN